MSVSGPCFLLVDDHALFRTGLGLMLAERWPQAQVLQAATWHEALATLRQHSPDLVMLDVHLPDGHGVADWPQLAALAPRCPVLLMSAQVDADQLRQALALGAAGFVPKSAPAADMLAAVQAAWRGERVFSALYGPVAADPLSTQAPHAVPTLHEREPVFTERQLQILRFLGKGTPNKAIARQLGVSENEVRAEVSWITEGLHAVSRQQAYDEAVSRGLVRP
jgi:two-component system nitrate/nitrite response regulator NarL